MADQTPSFKVKPWELDLIAKAVDRAVALYDQSNIQADRLTLHMDLTAAHANDGPLDFAKLLDFPDFDFMHDIVGINRHIDRFTGKLGDCFVPRCAA